MKSIILIVLLTICTTSYGLSCVINGNRESLEESLVDFKSDQFMKKVQDLSVVKDDNYDLCRVELHIDYKEQKLFIDFSEHLRESELEDEDVQIDVIVGADEIKDIHVHHYVEHACSDEKCEKDFIKKYLDWFVKFDYAILQAKLSQLILNETTGPGQCFDDSGSLKKCSSGHCIVIIFRNEDEDKEISTSQFCADDDKIILEGFHFVTEFDLKFVNILSQYEFYCNYNECNDHSTVSCMKEIIKEEYNVPSILKMFGYKSEDGGKENESTISSTKPSASSRCTMSFSSSTSQQKTNLMTSTTVTNPMTSTTVTNPNINQTIPTTQPNSGMHLQSTNAIIYVVLMTFLPRFIFLA